MTYTALACLFILHDSPSNSCPLEGLDKAALAKGIGMLQRPDGSFNFSSEGGEENDMRFVFCAVACCHMLSDWSSVDCDAVVRYILASQAYDGGIAQGPGLEAHGGSTYCAIASLHLMGRLDSAFCEKRRRKLVWNMNLSGDLIIYDETFLYFSL